MVLADYINSESRIAYPDFDLLAEKTGYHRTTVIEAINAGRNAKIVHRLRKGGKVAGRGLANEYTFPLTREEIVAHRLPIPDTPTENSSQPGMELVASGHKNSSQPATPYSDNTLNHTLSIAPPSSSALGGHSSGVALKDSKMPNSANAVPAGARSPTQSIEESAEQKRGRPSEEARRQHAAAALAQMEASGLDFSQSKWRRPKL